ncbi:hypothetical protein E4T39_06267 [Aureobasidium subglaciale]|nr:hypothetical protein E4T39_06267 [Aureobasidium subglaciale]
MSAHVLCQPIAFDRRRTRLDRLPRLEALAIIATSPPGEWEPSSPVYSPIEPNPSVHFVQPVPPAVYALPLPAGWTADAGGSQSELMALVVQYTTEITRILQDLVEPIVALRRNVAFTNVRLSRVVTWCEDYITRIVATTNTYTWQVRQAEDEVAANSVHALQARTDLVTLEHEIRRVAGELSPPRSAAVYTPGHRRRNAISADSGSQDLDIPDPAIADHDAVLSDTLYDSDGSHVRSDSDGDASHSGGDEADADDDMADA